MTPAAHRAHEPTPGGPSGSASTTADWWTGALSLCWKNGATMGSRFCSLLLSLARLFVGYPASFVADALETVRCRHQTLFDLLVRVPVGHAAAHLAPRNDAAATRM